MRISTSRRSKTNFESETPSQSMVVSNWKRDLDKQGASLIRFCMLFAIVMLIVIVYHLASAIYNFGGLI